MNLSLERFHLPPSVRNTWEHVKSQWLAIRPQKTPEELSREELEDALREAKYELDIAYANFECAYNNDLIDICTYRLKAAQTYYNYLTKLVKEKNQLVS